MKSPHPGPAVEHAHTHHADDVLKALDSVATGLRSQEAAKRLEEWGPNELSGDSGISGWRLLLGQFKNVLIIILLIATAISAFLGHGVEAIAIFAIVLFAVILGFVQEYRAERAVDALRRMAVPLATVLRDGMERHLPARELIPGDVMLLAQGQRIAADARILEAVNLRIEEAALTGESHAVDKNEERIDRVDCPLGDRSNMIYAGTAVAHGRGKAVVTATGMSTEFGRIAHMLQTVETGKTPLQHYLDKLGRVLAWAALVIVAGIVVLGLMRGQPFLEILVFGIALAVAVVPEALPAVVTISLALGVQRLIRRRALMRRLPAVEALGSTSVICSDKTGTLTRNEMSVRTIQVSGRMLDVSGSGYAPEGSFLENDRPVELTPTISRLLTAAVLDSDAHLAQEEDGSWTVQGDPTEGALLAAAAKAGLEKNDLDARYPRIAEIPFESETKRMVTVHLSNGEHKTGEQNTFACAKGAPEVILDLCTHVAADEGDRPIDESTRKDIHDAAADMASRALRVLAMSEKRPATLETAQDGMTFLGLLGLIDPPRPEAGGAVAECRQAGIRVIMITGDHPVTARAIASELGVLPSGWMSAQDAEQSAVETGTPGEPPVDPASPPPVLTGAELDQLDEETFRERLSLVNVYARVSPAHKLRVIDALQEQGEVVAMTGDGVNDAPALKSADIGVAMGITGTDVAREAAAMTLTDDNFATLVAAVEEGRGIFANIRKYLMFLLSSNIGEIGLIAGAALAGLPMPLTAVQILYVNLLTDGLPALALALDPAESDLMRRKPRDPKAGIFSRPVTILMMAGGIWSIVVNLGLFIWAMSSGRSAEESMTMTFVSLVLIQFIKAYNFRSDRRSLLHRPFANRWLNLAILVELGLLALIVYVPVFHEPFGTFSLTGEDWLIIGAISLTISPVLELVKWMARKGWLGALDQARYLER